MGWIDVDLAPAREENGGRRVTCFGEPQLCALGSPAAPQRRLLHRLAFSL